MKIKAIILGSLLAHCLLYSLASAECTIYPDPNDYIDDPNTLENGLFECGDSNLTAHPFTPPIYWERTPHLMGLYLDDCYASIHPIFQPNGAEWEIMNPFEGDNFVVLSTGGFGTVNDNKVKGSKISQEVFLSYGDTILGAYFFGTIDYQPFNDYASIYLEPTTDPNDPNNFISIAQCDVETVGDYLSTAQLPPVNDGWIPFSHTIEEPNQTGTYFFRCEVVDANDRKINSYLAIDGLRICRGGQSVADLDSDCDVDLLDYSILSEAWLAFCPDDPNGIDPNDITDPNIPCQLADIDNNWYVDPNDLVIMSNDWLYNTEPNSL